MLMADILARMPDLRQRAQTMHAADVNGQCQECGSQVRWPCEIAQIAVEAERLQSLPRPRLGLDDDRDTRQRVVAGVR